MHGGAGERVVLDIAPGAGDPARFWLVRARYGATWITDVVSAAERSHAVRPPATRGAPDEVRVSALDRVGRESAATIVHASGRTVSR
jgi:hypothetical protein